MKSLFLVLFFSSVMFAKTISIGVASNVTYVIDELIKEFKKTDKNLNIRVNIGSSGKLVAQTRRFAPYDILILANESYPMRLYKDGFSSIKPKVYASGTLSYFSISKNLLDVDMKSFLLSSKISKIAIANPKTAPYGIATIEVFKNIGILDRLKSKFVYAESVSQTISYTMIATDIGVVASSALYSDKMSKYKKGINYKKIDTTLYEPIKQSAIILKEAISDKDAMSFYKFLFSKKAKEIFKRNGYII